jgi:hypothetical protein
LAWFTDVVLGTRINTVTRQNFPLTGHVGIGSRTTGRGQLGARHASKGDAHAAREEELFLA